MFASLALLMAAATKKRKEKKKLTLGRPALVEGTKQTLSNLFWRLLISMRQTFSDKRLRNGHDWRFPRHDGLKPNFDLQLASSGVATRASAE